MMLTNSPPPLAAPPPDSALARVKPLELTLAPSSGVAGAGPGQGVVPSLSMAAQSLQEVSIHKTVMPPRTLSPPLCPSLCSRPASAQGPPSSLPGHPREGQSASLLGGKFILLDEVEGSTLHRCLDITSQEELVCKVSSTQQLSVAPSAWPRLTSGAEGRLSCDPVTQTPRRRGPGNICAAAASCDRAAAPLPRTGLCPRTSPRPRPHHNNVAWETEFLCCCPG